MMGLVETSAYLWYCSIGLMVRATGAYQVKSFITGLIGLPRGNDGDWKNRFWPSIVAQRRIMLVGMTKFQGVIDSRGVSKWFLRGWNEFTQHNQAQVDVVVESEQKTRRQTYGGEDVLVDFIKSVSAALYQKRYAQMVTSSPGVFWNWCSCCGTMKFLLMHTHARYLAKVLWPFHWPMCFANSEDDGVTVHIPLALLNQVTLNRFEWLVWG